MRAAAVWGVVLAFLLIPLWVFAMEKPGKHRSGGSVVPPSASAISGDEGDDITGDDMRPETSLSDASPSLPGIENTDHINGNPVPPPRKKKKKKARSSSPEDPSLSGGSNDSNLVTSKLAALFLNSDEDKRGRSHTLPSPRRAVPPPPKQLEPKQAPVHIDGGTKAVAFQSTSDQATKDSPSTVDIPVPPAGEKQQEGVKPSSLTAPPHSGNSSGSNPQGNGLNDLPLTQNKEGRERCNTLHRRKAPPPPKQQPKGSPTSTLTEQMESEQDSNHNTKADTAPLSGASKSTTGSIVSLTSSKKESKRRGALLSSFAWSRSLSSPGESSNVFSLLATGKAKLMAKIKKKHPGPLIASTESPLSGNSASVNPTAKIKTEETTHDILAFPTRLMVRLFDPSMIRQAELDESQEEVSDKTALRYLKVTNLLIEAIKLISHFEINRDAVASTQEIAAALSVYTAIATKTLTLKNEYQSELFHTWLELYASASESKSLYKSHSRFTRKPFRSKDRVHSLHVTLSESSLEGIILFITSIQERYEAFISLIKPHIDDSGLSRLESHKLISSHDPEGLYADFGVFHSWTYKDELRETFLKLISKGESVELYIQPIPGKYVLDAYEKLISETMSKIFDKSEDPYLALANFRINFQTVIYPLTDYKSNFKVVNILMVVMSYLGGITPPSICDIPIEAVSLNYTSSPQELAEVLKRGSDATKAYMEDNNQEIVPFEAAAQEEGVATFHVPAKRKLEELLKDIDMQIADALPDYLH